MSNAKRFLSVILAIIMVCSTLVIGASATYNAYKDSAILGEYNALDEPVLTTEQYASAAMDEVDRMLNEEQLKFTRADIVVGDVDLTSINNTMTSVYSLVNGTLFKSLSGLLGELGNLTANSFASVRRGPETSYSDLDVIYAVLGFLYENKQIFVDFVKGGMDLGSILPSLVDVSEYTDVNKLLKGLLYEATYDEDAPATITKTVDEMVQDIIDRYVIDEFEVDDVKIGHYFEGLTDISSGSMYKFIDKALKALYNAMLVPALNDSIKREVGKLCGYVYTKNGDGTYTVDKSGENAYAQLLNTDYVVAEHDFSKDPANLSILDQLNSLVKEVADVLINPAVFVWQGGNDNSLLKTNIANLAKAALVNTGRDFFASYIEVATPDEVNAMTPEQLTAYALRAIINGSVDGMYIPNEATTIRQFGYYALKQLIATSVPSLDFSSMNKESTETIFIMAIDYAIYSVNAQLDMGLEYVYTMDGVEAQLKKAAQYAINNYGGLLNGITFNAQMDGWDLIEAILFRIIDRTWLPSEANGSVKTFLMDCVLNNILDLDFEGLVDIFAHKTGTENELANTPKQVVINRLVSIVNTIIPNAFQSATTIGALVENLALSGTVNALFELLGNPVYNVPLTASVLPLVCNILELTSKQEFEFPKITYNKMLYSQGNLSYDINVRNNSTGINTGYTDANGEFHQDALYTYKIKSITSSVPSVTITAGDKYLTAGSTLETGVTKSIHLSGGFTASGILKVTMKYDVLTEKGTALTENPIQEDIYLYLTTANSDNTEDDVIGSTAVGGFRVSKVPKYYYATSFNDVTKITMTVQNTNSTAVTLYPASNYTTGSSSSTNKFPYDANGKCYLELNNGADAGVTVIPQVDGQPGVGRITPFKLTDEYRALDSEGKQAAWESVLGAMIITGRSPKNPVTECYIGVTDNKGNTSKCANGKIFLYNDYGLDSLVDSELNKHRQASSYGDASAWSAYQTALEAAVSTVYSPFVNGTFADGKSGKATKYQATSEDLEAAIEALDASTLSAGVEDLQALMDSLAPDNGDKEYDDPYYNYFGVADYVDYTYYNYRDEFKAAQKIVDKVTASTENPKYDEETGVQTNKYTLSELDKTYMMHRLALYGERLLPTTPDKRHLAAELNSLTRTSITVGTQGDWSEESWANFERAYAFADSVNKTAVSALKQSKIDTALEELLEAEKRLVKGGEPQGEKSIEIVDPTGKGELTVLETASGNVLTGVTPKIDPESFFQLEGYTVQITNNSTGKFSTGAVVEIIDPDTGSVVKTYTVSVYADVDGDNDLTVSDISKCSTFASGKITPTDAQKLASDVDLDTDIGVPDISRVANFASGKYTPDFVNRGIVK